MQGGEGDCFYVVGNGEFEVLAMQVIIWGTYIMLKNANQIENIIKNRGQIPNKEKTTWSDMRRGINLQA